MSSNLGFGRVLTTIVHLIMACGAKNTLLSYGGLRICRKKEHVGSLLSCLLRKRSMKDGIHHVGLHS